MPHLPKAREAIKIAQNLGFYFVRQRGSHKIYRHSDGRRITIPVHSGKELSPGVFGQILKDLDITPEEFWRL